MLLNTRTTRILIEAAEDWGIPRKRLLEPLGLAERDVVDPGTKVEWRTVVLLAEQLARLVEGDPTRLQDIGSRMTRVPSHAPLRRLAGVVVSVRTLYDIASRFAGPANFPHLIFRASFDGERRMHMHGEIPLSYMPCEPFFHLFIGSVAQLPILIGLPPAALIESHVTPRTCDLVVALPPSRSFLDRLRRGAQAAFGARDALAVLDEQQRELAVSVEALQRAREDLRALLDRLPDVVVVLASGNVLWANRAFLAAVGCEAEEVLGRSIGEMVVGGRPDMLLEEATQRADRSGAAVLSELALKTRTGHELIVELAPTEAVVFDGVSATLVVGRDITERTRLRQNLVVADRLASIGLLAAGVAHEVNNPLAYVLNNIEIARRELTGFGAAADVSRDALLIALEGVDRIRAIVRDLLMLSRGDEGKARAIDVQSVAESTLALAGREIDRTSRLVQDYQPAPLVYASYARIAQVLLNLIANALEAMRGRPREENELFVRVARGSAGRVLIEISDTGRGIEKAHLPRLFEPFFTTKAAGEGTGLGLSIAQRLVGEIGGEITVSSVFGRGTKFQVLLPPAPPEESLAAAP